MFPQQAEFIYFLKKYNTQKLHQNNLISIWTQIIAIIFMNKILTTRYVYTAEQLFNKYLILSFIQKYSLNPQHSVGCQ